MMIIVNIIVSNNNNLVEKLVLVDQNQKEILIKVVGLMVNTAEVSQGILVLSNSNNYLNILMISKMEISA